MKFKKNFKKGFTLVELIVVIAIVAILAAVSVVSYIAFINSANESADIQLVKQLNTALQGDQALNGIRKTPTEMLGAMEENGFVIENLTKTKSGYDIVWDQKNNRFALLKGEDKVYAESSFNNDGYLNKSLITKLVDNVQEATAATNLHYSIYLTEAFGDTESLNVSSGVDVGNNVINTINYVNDVDHPQTVVIRTNGGKLVVNSPSDTITHYGIAYVIDVNDVAPTTYKENGTVSELNINTGNHIEIQSGATVYKMNIAQSVTSPNISVSNDAILGVLFNESSATVTGLPQNVKVVNKNAIETSSADSSIAFVGTADDFKTAIETNTITTIKLIADIVIPANHANNLTSGIYSLRDGLVIDGQGFEIKCANDFPAFKVKTGWGGQSGIEQGYVSNGGNHECENNIFYVDQGHSVTIKNLFIDGNGKPKHGINCFGNMNIEDVVAHGFRGSTFNANGNKDAVSLTINATRLSAYDCVWSTMCFDKGAAGTKFNINLKDCTIINEHAKAAKYGVPDAYEYALKFDGEGNYVATVVVDGGYIESILTNDAVGSYERATNIIYK